MKKFNPHLSLVLLTLFGSILFLFSLATMCSMVNEDRLMFMSILNLVSLLVVLIVSFNNLIPDIVKDLVK